MFGEPGAMFPATKVEPSECGPPDSGGDGGGEGGLGLPWGVPVANPRPGDDKTAAPSTTIDATTTSSAESLRVEKGCGLIPTTVSAA